MGLFDKLQKNKQNESTNINQENKYDNWKDYKISVSVTGLILIRSDFIRR